MGGLLCDAHQHTAKGDPQPASRKLHFRQTHDDAPSFAADDAVASFAPVDSSSGLAYRGGRTALTLQHVEPRWPCPPIIVA